MRFLLVGGAVRDLLSGHVPKDLDYLVLGAGAEEMRARFPHAVEVSSPVTTFIIQGREVSLPRRGEAGDTPLMTDLLARDFTVNAMALDEEGFLTMHPQAMEDLHAGILRPCGKDSLTSDPLRVFRAARFLASWPDFQPSRDLLAAMAETARHGLLERIPAERMGRETLAAMNASNPGRYLQVLDRTGCLAPWFRELENASSIPAGPGPYHDSDTLTHIGRVMDALAGRQEPLLPWMGLCHDLGKTATDPDILPSHHGHEVRGADMATQLGRRLRMPERWVLAGATAARHHMVLARYRELRPGTRVDLLMELHAKRLVREMVALVQADRSSSPHRSPAPGLAEAVESDLAAVLAVRLPAEHRDQGEASGQRLRQMRCKALDRS